MGLLSGRGVDWGIWEVSGESGCSTADDWLPDVGGDEEARESFLGFWFYGEILQNWGKNRTFSKMHSMT
jgi:hypothetical protein